MIPLRFPPSKSPRRTARAAAATALAAMLLSACVSSSSESARVHGIDLSAVPYGRDLPAVPDAATGRIHHVSEFAGRVPVVFFGYTHCPDICPTALADIAHARSLMGEHGAKLQPIFVSLDPERDTPEILAAYTAAFDPTMLALRGSAEQTSQAMRTFNLYAQKVPGRDAESYILDHSAGLYLYGPDGALRSYHAHNAGGKMLAHDALVLLGVKNPESIIEKTTETPR